LSKPGSRKRANILRRQLGQNRGWANCPDIGSRRLSYANRGSSSFDNVSRLYKRTDDGGQQHAFRGMRWSLKNLLAIDSMKKLIPQEEKRKLLLRFDFLEFHSLYIYFLLFWRKEFFTNLLDVHCQESPKNCTSRGMWRHVCLCFIYSELRATLRQTGGYRGKVMQTISRRGVAYTTLPRPHPLTYNSHRSTDSCGIMQFAHETYGNTRFPCASTKLQTRVFHSSSFLDDSAVTIGQTLFQLNIYIHLHRITIKRKYVNVISRIDANQ